tara:strand:- start:284 stop:766 length:483 start_codon:yes stop_codon:yes gene_type:complete
MDSKIRIEVKKISDEIVEDFRKELIQQGYFASGSLDKSFKVRIQHKPSLINVDVFSNDYAKILNYGAKPFYPDIKEIERWVEDKGFANTPAEKKQIARSVASRIAQEGLPHPNKSFSKNGRRTRFIDTVVEKKQDDIMQRLVKAFDQQIELYFNIIPNTI